jgi:hypothetical protein
MDMDHKGKKNCEDKLQNIDWNERHEVDDAALQD